MLWVAGGSVLCVFGGSCVCGGFCGWSILLRLGEAGNLIGDIEDELVVATYMVAGQFLPYINSSGLPRAFKVQQRSPVLERIGDWHVRDGA